MVCTGGGEAERELRAKTAQSARDKMRAGDAESGTGRRGCRHAVQPRSKTPATPQADLVLGAGLVELGQQRGD